MRFPKPSIANLGHGFQCQFSYPHRNHRLAPLLGPLPLANPQPVSARSFQRLGLGGPSGQARMSSPRSLASAGSTFASQSWATETWTSLASGLGYFQLLLDIRNPTKQPVIRTRDLVLIKLQDPIAGEMPMVESSKCWRTQLRNNLGHVWLWTSLRSGHPATASQSPNSPVPWPDQSPDEPVGEAPTQHQAAGCAACITSLIFTG